MSQAVTRKLLVVGGSGFLGLNICKLSANKQWETISLSRRGEPEQFKQFDKPDWAQKVQWVSGDSLKPETYKDILTGVTDVVHSVGILMEANYKKLAQAQSLCETAGQLPRFVLGMKDGGNPLDSALETNPKPTFEMMNRDTAKMVADQVAQLPSINSFTYISATDVFPFINPRYITTKREAEMYLFKQEKFKTVVLRPGVMYNFQRPSILPLANFLQFTNAITSPFKDTVSSLPGGKMLTTPPLRTEEVARAVIHGIEKGEHGIFDVEGIVKLSCATV